MALPPPDSRDCSEVERRLVRHSSKSEGGCIRQELPEFLNTSECRRFQVRPSKAWEPKLFPAIRTRLESSAERNSPTPTSPSSSSTTLLTIPPPTPNTTPTS